MPIDQFIANVTSAHSVPHFARSIVQLVFPIPFPTDSNEFLNSFSNFNFTNLLSFKWWLTYILDAYEKEPGHVLMEIICILIIIYLLFRTPYDPSKDSLTPQEEQELIEEWKPLELAPQLPNWINKSPPPIVYESTKSHVTIEDTDHLNFAASNYLGLSGHNCIKIGCQKTIEKYGIGSCGPRGFYGTFDAHLELEDELSRFFGAQSCILYSDGLACISSIIPAFAKRGDLIICDEGCSYAIQQGIRLSRSSVLYYKHNSIEDLERVLQQIAEQDIINKQSEITKFKFGRNKLNRRFIVTEGIFAYSGAISNLARIVQLKKTYKYRVILDDSHAIGVLGTTGRGSIEHHSVDVADVDFLCGTLDTSLSTIGGFCVGSDVIVNHQRLSGAGYCFSAAQPPYSCTAGTIALKLIDDESWRLEQLQKNCQLMYQLVSRSLTFSFEMISGCGSAIIQFRLSTSKNSEIDKTSQMNLFREFKYRLMSKYRIVSIVPDYIFAERNPPLPSLKLLICSYHTESDLSRTADAIGDICQEFESSIKNNLTKSKFDTSNLSSKSPLRDIQNLPISNGNSVNGVHSLNLTSNGHLKQRHHSNRRNQNL